MRNVGAYSLNIDNVGQREYGRGVLHNMVDIEEPEHRYPARLRFSDGRLISIDSREEVEI